MQTATIAAATAQCNNLRTPKGVGTGPEVADYANPLTIGTAIASKHAMQSANTTQRSTTTDGPTRQKRGRIKSRTLNSNNLCTEKQYK